MPQINNENELWQRLQNHDEKAFRQFIDLYQGPVYNLCIDWVMNPHDAEELAQDVFTDAYRKVINFRGESSIKTWLFRIAINKCADFLKAKNRVKRRMISSSSPESDVVGIPDSHPHPGFQLEQKENVRLLYRALDEIPPAQKSAFLLFEAEGMSYEEIAGILHKSIPSVESLLSRARSNLRKKLSAYFKS